VGAFGSIEDALEDLPPADVILLDIHLPGQSGTDSIRTLKERCPGVHVVMLTVFDDDQHVFRAVVEGADGYILKRTPPSEIISSIQDAASGGAPMTPYIARRILALFKQYAPVGKEDHDLSPRELEILRLLALGLDSREIADRLFISRETVRNHSKHIYEKLHVHSRSQAVARAIREGIV
jgi:DNA-binding NarL/FixJ family response regulator